MSSSTRCDTNTWQPRPTSSLEYVWTTITAQDASGEAIDPTDDAVAFSIVPEDDPPSTYTAGVWRTVTEDKHGNPLPEPVYQAAPLVGPGGIALTAAHWWVYVKVTDSPEIPIRLVVDDRGQPKVLIIT